MKRSILPLLNTLFLLLATLATACNQTTKTDQTTATKPAGAPTADTATLGKKPGWWKETVVYQLSPLSFQDSNGDGVGDRGIDAGVAECRRERDTKLAERPRRRLLAKRRIERKRIAAVRAGDHGQQQRRIGGAARDRSDVGECRRRALRPDRHAARRCAKADDVAKRNGRLVGPI